ncbi:hypothetical protein ES703_96400 [subsurface metagenome]
MISAKEETNATRVVDLAKGTKARAAMDRIRGTAESATTGYSLCLPCTTNSEVTLWSTPVVRSTRRFLARRALNPASSPSLMALARPPSLSVSTTSSSASIWRKPIARLS